MFKFELSMLTLAGFLRINNLIKVMANCFLQDGPRTCLFSDFSTHSLCLGQSLFLDFHCNTYVDKYKQTRKNYQLDEENQQLESGE